MYVENLLPSVSRGALVQAKTCLENVPAQKVDLDRVACIQAISGLLAQSPQDGMKTNFTNDTAVQIYYYVSSS